MTAYLEPAEIEIEWRKTSKGICIIVEGETAQDDAWYFGKWFDKQAQLFTFLPQNGFEKVIAAVAHLRPALGTKKVYGIRDRDFEPLTWLDPCPENGIFYTPKYTLENYLLDPVCWYQVMKPLSQRNSVKGWMSVDEISETIAGYYRRCLPLSAFNSCLQFARKANFSGFQTLTENKEYRESPKALQGIDVHTYLNILGEKLALLPRLSDEYRKQLDWLQNSDYSVWEQFVSGKYVLKLIKEEFPLGNLGKPMWEGVLNTYMDCSVTPPDDLENILEAIKRDSQIQ